MAGAQYMWNKFGLNSSPDLCRNISISIRSNNLKNLEQHTKEEQCSILKSKTFI